MQLELVKLQKAVGITFVIVTHDQDEALSMADRIAVMENGVVRQVAPPGELYESPNCRFVADFIGRMNLFSGIVEGHEDVGVLIVKTEQFGKLTIPHFEKLSGKLHRRSSREVENLKRDSSVFSLFFPWGNRCGRLPWK